jgi:hypothetical protein
LQGVDDPMRHVLRAGAQMKHRTNLGARVDGQPEPEHLLGAAQPRAEFVQLEMRELQGAKGALVQPRERGGKLMAQRYRQRTEADGSRENESTVDCAGSAVLSLAAGAMLQTVSVNET